MKSLFSFFLNIICITKCLRPIVLKYLTDRPSSFVFVYFLVLCNAVPAKATTTTCYTYDDLGQLTEYRIVEQTETELAYDDAGNPVQVTTAADPPSPSPEREILFLPFGEAFFPIPQPKVDVCAAGQP